VARFDVMDAEWALIEPHLPVAAPWMLWNKL
jgi:transposase